MPVRKNNDLVAARWKLLAKIIRAATEATGVYVAKKIVTGSRSPRAVASAISIPNGIMYLEFCCMLRRL